MLRPRIIPCLLVHGAGLVKTVGFASPKYVGDPLNAVRIFNEKEVDELMVLDIDATARQREPDYARIRALAAECRMPLCYGGGVKSVEQVEKIVGLGVEKVAISSAAVDDPELVARMADVVGSQSVVVVLDVRRSAAGVYEVYTHNGTRNTRKHPAEFAVHLESLGVGRDRREFHRSGRRYERLRHRAGRCLAQSPDGPADGAWRRRHAGRHWSVDARFRKHRGGRRQSVRVQGGVSGGADQLSEPRRQGCADRPVSHGFIGARNAHARGRPALKESR